MSKLIIWVPGKIIQYGYRRRTFQWSPAHNCYIYQGKEFTEREFNGVVDQAMKDGADMHVSVKVVQFNEEPAPRAAITAQEAENVLRKLAPERLKLKPGPKPQLVEIA